MAGRKRSDLMLSRVSIMRHMKSSWKHGYALVLVVAFLFIAGANASDQWVDYMGHDGPGQGKHIVLISGDEEYRSEEALPQLGKILAMYHGFDCRVLFAIDPKTGLINPNHTKNIPGLSSLKGADLIIVFLRRRDLSDEQMQHFDDYLKSGKPVIGIRTATHSFFPAADSKWAHYGDTYKGKKKEWENGFGRLVLGETWISHHGNHKHQSTRGIIAPGAADHPILRGIENGAIWGATDVYGVRLPLPGDATPLVLGQVIARKGEYDESDLFYGMRPDDGPPVSGAKNDPMMPIAWTKSYQIPGGKRGVAFASTIGASVDLTNEAVRRLFVNAVYFCLGMKDKIPEKGTKVDIVGDYRPTKFEFRKEDYWARLHMSIEEHKLKE
jgi:Trehalose utilisation